MKHSLREKIKQNRRLYIILSIALFFVLMAFCSFLLAPLVIKTLDDPPQFQRLIASKGAVGYIIFILIQIIQVVFAFIPGEIVEVGAGYAFGAFYGLVFCLIGVAISSALVFLLVRKFGHSFALVIMDTKTVKKLSFLRDTKKLELILFVLYFVPGTPKDIITYFAGLTPVDTRVFLLICTLGRIPSILTSTLAGDSLVKSDYKTSILIFAVTAVIALAGYFIYERIANRKTD